MGSKTLVSSHVSIDNLIVEINADGTAGGCSFELPGLYDFEQGCYLNELSSVIKPGEKVIVKGGYGGEEKLQELFYGYVDDYSMTFQQDGVPSISVNAVDGLGYLMDLREPIYAGQKKAKEIVTEILSKSKNAGFAKSITISALDDFEMPIIKEQIDDWKFLKLMAQRHGATLFVIDGEMIFDTVVSNASPIITLTLGRELNSFEKRVSMAHQVGKVEVWGRDVNQKAIKGEASTVSISGDGKTAAQHVSALADAVLRQYSEFVMTQDECKKIAQHRLDSIAMGLVSGQGQVIGIPELIPGRYLEIKGGDEHANGKYYISKVRHIFSDLSYVTQFEVKGART